jgi:maleate isomerase
MTLEYSPLGLIGTLTPQANTTVEPEFSVLCPPGYAFINARLTSRKNTIEARLVDYWHTIDRTLDQFANAPVSAYAFGCTGTSYLVGAEAEKAVVARIEADRGAPFITSARAVVDALNAIPARTIGLVSPYPPDLTQASIAYWQNCGFEVAEVSSAFNPGSTFHPIYSLPAASARDALALLKTRDLDAVVMLGTGMPTLAPILEVAGRDGPPVMSCMLCLAWRTVEVVKGVTPNRDTLKRWIAGEGWGSRLTERRIDSP